MSGIISRAFSLWLLRPLWISFWRPLDEEETPALFANFRAEPIFDRKVTAWRAHMRPLWREILVNVVPMTYFCGFVLGLLAGIVTTVGRPLCLQYVVSNIVSGRLTAAKTISLMVFLSCIILVEGLLTIWSRFLLRDHVCAKTFAFLSSLIVDKVASGPNSGTHNPTSLIGNDVSRLMENILWSSGLPLVVSSLIGAVWMLLVILGPPSLLGVAISFSIMVVNIGITRVTRAAEKANLAAADVRLHLIKQTLTKIAGVKYFGWEASCMAQITQARDIECVKIRRFRTFQMLSFNLGRMSPVLSCVFTFVLYGGILHRPMVASDIFAALIIFQAMRMSLILVPLTFTAMSNALLSLRRIEDFCRSPDYAPRTILPDDTSIVAELSFAECILTSGSDLDQRRFVLKDVHLTVSRGTLVAVTGPVGSGKSTLLQALIGALPLDGGSGDEARTAYKIALVPQRPVTLNATILENVLLGLCYDEDLWMSVVEASQLGPDLELLPDGRDTLVGENGTTLSGGQQMRLSVARALYCEPDLLLMDDPLAALDHVVGSALLKSVRGYVDASTGGQQKAAVIVLNQHHMLSSFDHIVWLDGGCVRAQGQPKEVASLIGFDIDMPCHGVVDDAVDESDAEEMMLMKTEVLTMPSASKLVTNERSTVCFNGAESRKRGIVSFSVYFAYIKAMGVSLAFLCFLVGVMAYTAMVMADRWLAYWLKNGSMGSDPMYPGVYVAISLTCAVCLVATSTLFAQAGMRASKTLHSRCLLRVLKAPMAWFEDTPSGRTLSRLSSDLSIVDLYLGFHIDNFWQVFLGCASMVVMIIVIVPYVAIVAAFVILTYVGQSLVIDRMNREIKRMRDNAMSPLQTNLNETLASQLLLQANDREGRLRRYFLQKNFEACDNWNRHNFTSHAIRNISQMSTYWLSFLFSLVACGVILGDNSIGPALSSLAFSYCFMVPYFLGMVVENMINLNDSFVSLERLLGLQSEMVPQEAWPLGDAFIGLQDLVVAWPSKGQISFEGVALRYRAHLPMSVCGVSFHVRGGERLGVIGRTGSGKSSLFVLLFRIVEACDGRILIDGVDISTVGLHRLRSSLGMIPQIPLLLAGTVRYNLDPFGGHHGSDDALRLVLERAELGHLSLDSDIGSDSSRLSAGEGQLLSFARCLLHDRRICVFDEPTASLDLATDAKLQALVRTAFADRTLMCIAHRLQTVIDFDRLLIMSAGSVAGLGTPQELLADRSSALSLIVDSGGSRLRAELERQLVGAIEEVGLPADVNSNATDDEAEQFPHRDFRSKEDAAMFSCDGTVQSQGLESAVTDPTAAAESASMQAEAVSQARVTRARAESITNMRMDAPAQTGLLDEALDQVVICFDGTGLNGESSTLGTDSDVKAESSRAISGEDRFSLVDLALEASCVAEEADGYHDLASAVEVQEDVLISSASTREVVAEAKAAWQMSDRQPS